MPEQYIAKAKALTANLAALDSLRASVRRRMLASPLCDAKRLCQELEVAYRQMWRHWCQKKQVESLGSSIAVRHV